MPTLTPTSTSTSNKTVVAFAVLGGVAVAAMVFFGFSAKRKMKDMNYLTPGYAVMPETLYRPLGDTPVIEEEKPRPIDPEMKDMNGMMINDNAVMMKKEMNLKGN